VSEEIIKISKVFKHPRRIKIINMLATDGELTAKEILDRMSDDVLPQYLYGDLELMRAASLIQRRFDDNSGCFIYSIKNKTVIITLTDMSVRWCDDF